MAALNLLSMDEEELLELDLTRHGAMEGASPLRRHDNVQKQISAFEKLLEGARERFSQEKLHQMLTLASRGIPSLPRGPRTSMLSHKQSAKISSMGQLRDIVERVSTGRRRGLEKEEEAYFIKYFTTFFSDIEYMRELKQYFDEKVYTCLYEYFYNPVEDVDDLNFRFSSKKDTMKSTPESTKRPLLEDVDVEELDDEEKLAYAVRKMYHINALWDKLFDEEHFDLKSFEPESYNELVEFEEFSDFEALLRLVPDMFVKAYKSVELAKIWWTQANKVYTLLPNKRNSSDTYRLSVKTLEEKIADLTSDIRKEEELLMVHEEDLRTIEQREARFNALSSSCEAVEERKNEIGRQYNEFLSQRESLTAELNMASKGSYKERSVGKALHRVGKQLNATSDELQLLTYNLTILQEDFQLELELRPTVIRYVETVREKVLELEASVRDKLANKRATEKRLALLRTNTEKMRDVMRRHLELNDAHRPDYLADNPDTFGDDNPVNGYEPRAEVMENGRHGNHNGDVSRKQVRYESGDEVHTYSADDESDTNVPVPSHDEISNRDTGYTSPKPYNGRKRGLNNTYNKDRPTIQRNEANRNDRPNPNIQTGQKPRRIPVLKQGNQEAEKRQKQTKDGVNKPSKTRNSKPKVNTDNSANNSPRIPRDEVTHKPERNDKPALIRLKPGAGEHTPDSGVGTDKSTPNKKTRADPYKNRRPSRVPQPALQPIPS